MKAFWPLSFTLVGNCCMQIVSTSSPEDLSDNSKRNLNGDGHTPPNILVFLVDDLGHTQVGYHAERVGNDEVKTPYIDQYAREGIELDRGYMTPWCGPSRAAIQTGRTNSYNQNVSSSVSTFDEDIGFVAGLPADTQTIATALKEYGDSIGKPYKTHYSGKWGIGGTAWTNTPMGLGYDTFRGFWTNGIEVCDGRIPVTANIQFVDLNIDKGFGPLLLNSLPGYWEQSPDFADTQWCEYMESLSDDLLSADEKFLACKTRPRNLTTHVDLDLVDNVVEQIRTHDYDAGPMFQFVSTAMLHLPLAYPKEYDDLNPNLPKYFQEGEEKPQPRNEDMRLATASALRFVDDVFGTIMEALQEDPAVWNSTIVLFTSDNGGAIYTGHANNNYPLRAAKFSPFEGGVRVPQFLAGGWVEQNLPHNRSSVSDTYFFPSDIAPTLLEMAGADPEFILKGKTGANYGNAMWQYIKNSVNPMQSADTHQKVRKVSYSPEVFFDVQADRTMKNFFTGNTPQQIPRLWSPIFPGNDELVTDNQYFSVNPCRPGGTPSNCCYLDIEDDPSENTPLEADCNAMYKEGKELFVIEGGCTEGSTKYMCQTENTVESSAQPEELSLWSHYGAIGPFTNSKGKPIDGLPMQCICDYKGKHVERVDYFTPSVADPTECYEKSIWKKKPRLAIPCDGLTTTPPIDDKQQAMRKQGLDVCAAKKVQKWEQRRRIALAAPDVAKLVNSYVAREGFTEWADAGKFPFILDGMNSCPEKNIVPVPWPITAVSPFFLSTPQPTIPYRYARTTPSFLGLCELASIGKYFCPSKDNADLQPIDHWSFGRGHLYGVFANGKKWRPMNPVKCIFHCKATPKGTAYIGDGEYGVVH